MNFDQFLNTAIPFILVIIVVAYVWWKFNEPLTHLFTWIGGLFSGGKDKVKTSIDGSYEIVYR